MGSWTDRKGAEKLVKIINLLHGKRSNARWVIAGVGKRGKEELLKSTLLKPEEVYEQVERNDLKPLYHKMTALLCLSSYESFGMVCSEALSCGCILVSTDVGFTNALKNGKEYIRIDRNNIHAIAEELHKIETAPKSYFKIKEEGYARAQRLRWRQAVEVIEKTT